MRNTLTKLLKELSCLYEQSEIKQYCINHGLQWHYALVTTKMIKDEPLIVGFNWGAAKGVDYKPQTTIEYGGFNDEDTGSLNRIKPFCSQYCGEEFLDSASQTNYCLFRSHKAEEIQHSDIKLCEPIFESLIYTLRPSVLLSFSSKLRDYLISKNKIADLQKKTIEFQSGERKVMYTTAKGNLGETPILFLPHPMYQMTSSARQEAWDFCFQGN